MANENEEKPAWLSDGPTLASETRAFSPDELVRCEECLRANPPTRSGCLYCAAPLPLTEAGTRLREPALRRLEDRERGFNLILLPHRRARLSEGSLVKMAELLRLRMEELLRVTEAGEPLPLARSATREEASLVEGRLRALGAETLTVDDKDLSLTDSAPKRLRTLELKSDELVAYPLGGDESSGIAWSDITLLVAGRLFARRVEVEERVGRGSENEIVEARELSADEAVLDIYAAGFEGNARIHAHSFDFSCLGEGKNLIAAQNFSTLVELLRERGVAALYDDSYQRLRRALSVAWPLEEHTGAAGLRRSRPGRFNTETVTTSDNERQFARYSRLRHYLMTRHPDLLA
ncbi:MAG TPA: hypothetical protein VF553_20315 [Pyrinomonadaceae bacterium]